MSTRRDYNWETIELWLLTRGRYVSTRPEAAHPDEYRDRSAKKRTGTPGQNASWLDAMNEPDVAATDRLLHSIILGDIRKNDADGYDVLRGVYLDEHADPSLPGFWEQRSGPMDRVRLAIWRQVMDDIIDKVGTRLLVLPYPEDAAGFLDEQHKKKRIARQTFFKGLDDGHTPAKARKEAIKASGASRRSVYYWTSSRKAKPKSKV